MELQPSTMEQELEPQTLEHGLEEQPSFIETFPEGGAIEDPEVQQKLMEFKEMIADAETKKMKRLWKPKDYLFLLFQLLCIVTLIFSCYLFYQIFLKQAIKALQDEIKEMSRSSGLFTYSFFTSIVFILSAFPLPAFAVICIMIAFVIGKLYIALLIIFVGQYIAAIVCMVFIRSFLKERFMKKYSSTVLFRLVVIECKKRPWTCSIISNIILLPACMKNYILPLTDMTLAQYYVPKIIFYAFFSYIFAKTGTTLDGIAQIDNEGSFSTMTNIQKFNFIVSISLITISIILIVVITTKFKKRYDGIQKEDKIIVLKGQFETKMKDSGVDEGLRKRVGDAINNFYIGDD